MLCYTAGRGKNQEFLRTTPSEWDLGIIWQKPGAGARIKASKESDAMLRDGAGQFSTTAGFWGAT